MYATSTLVWQDRYEKSHDCNLYFFKADAKQSEDFYESVLDSQGNQ